jgi:uncharacterized membrane protein YjgN (DUF898 family)
MNETVTTSVPSIPPAPAAVPAQGDAIKFTGVRRDFRFLVARGAMLELLTLGFYRFWLATDMRRHLWSHTEVGGDVPEYTGTAKELLIGFLFALAILGPIYLGYFILGLEAERLKAFASFPLALFFYLFTQFAIYRARRYRLSRTVWRGVRFWMKGSGWAYALRAGLWMLLTIVTLGIALPWQQAALERYKMRNTCFGMLQASFDATGVSLFKQGWWIWLLMWPSIFVVIPLPFLYAAYRAVLWKWWVSGVRFGELRFECGLVRSALIDLYWKVIGWGVVILIALSVWVGTVFGIASLVVSADVSAEQRATLIFQNPVALASMAGGYLVAALVLGMVVRIYLTRDLWQRVADATLVENLSAADNVAAQGDAVSALGEGFADSLDVAGF